MNIRNRIYDSDLFGILYLMISKNLGEKNNVYFSKLELCNLLPNSLQSKVDILNKKKHLKKIDDMFYHCDIYRKAIKPLIEWHIFGN